MRINCPSYRPHPSIWTIFAGPSSNHLIMLFLQAMCISRHTLSTFFVLAILRHRPPKNYNASLGIADNEVLRIGDLGSWGGNDFDLLNQGLSLSVDRVSSNLDTCWNLGPPGSKGITTTMQYLRALFPADGAFEASSRLPRAPSGER